MIRIYIDNGSGPVDYSKYVVMGSISVEDSLNQPTTASFQLSNFDSNFVVPSRSAYVQIQSTKDNLYLATGFVTQEPQRVFLGPDGKVLPIEQQKSRLTYDVIITSDEWLLNVKTVPFLPAFVNQTMGSIIETLAEALAPGFFSFTNVQDGDIVPFFKYDPKKMWSEVIKEFADQIRYRYKVLNRAISFVPYGDSSLAVHYNDSPTRTSNLFDPRALQTSILPTPVINDVIVIGDVEPRNYVENNFIGDGFTSDFPIKKKVFRGASSLLLQEDWDGSSFKTDLWDVVDPTGRFSLNGALNIQPGTPQTLGSSYIVGKNGVELGGHLNFQHAEVSFPTSVSGGGIGIIGGVYSSTVLSQANCLVGFFVSGGRISPIVSGVIQASLSQVSVTGHYLLQTVLDAGKWSRYDRIYRTLAGTSSGGTDISAKSDVMFMVTEIPITPGGVSRVRKTENLSISPALPSFGIYAPVNSINLNCVITSTQISHPPQAKLLVKSLVGPSGNSLPVLPTNLGTEQKYLLGFGFENQTATIQETADIQQLRFYSDTIPGVGARIKLRHWEAGRAVARVRDSDSVATEAKIAGDDGIRAAMVTDLNPAPRTSSECELAGSAFIEDRVETQYNGTYTFMDDFWNTGDAEENVLLESGAVLNLESSGGLDIESGDLGGVDYPRTGRFFPLLSPMRNIPTVTSVLQISGLSARELLVRKVTMKVGRQDIEKIEFTVEFGPDLYINKLLPKFLRPAPEQVLTSKDVVDRPDPQDIADIGLTFIGDLPDATVTNITGTQITVDLGQVPVTGAEVRRIDSGWGRNDNNRITVVTTQTFTLTRTQYDETFYIRQLNGAKTSRYTSELRIVYPLIPTAPVGTIDIRDYLKPVAVLDLTQDSDIRNIEGIEIRSCMVNVAASGVTGGFADIQQPFELLDEGLIARDPSNNSTITVVKQDYLGAPKRFTRSEFLFDPSLFGAGADFFFEGEVTNSSFDTPRKIYVEKQMRGRDGNPVIVHSMTVPPQTHRQFIRFTEEFTGWQYDSFPPTVTGPTVTGGNVDYTDAYRILMDPEAPPTLVYSRPPAINPNSVIFPASSFELHNLRLRAFCRSTQKTVIEIPLSGLEAVSTNDVGESEFSTGSQSYVDIPTAGIWRYLASEWATIKKVRFQATLSAVSVTGGHVYAGLYDIDAATVVSEAIFTISGSSYAGQCATVESSYTPSGSNLIDGHKYTVRMKIDFPAAFGHFYKSRLWLVVDPLTKLNIYWRYCEGIGSQPFKVSDAGTFACSPGEIQSRFIYDPDILSQMMSVFIEGSGKGTNIQDAADDFNRANGPLGANWTSEVFGSAPSIVSNQVQTKDLNTNYFNNPGAISTHQYAQLRYMAFITGANHRAGPMVFIQQSGIFANRHYYGANWGTAGGPASLVLERFGTGAGAGTLATSAVNPIAGDMIFISADVSGANVNLVVKINDTVVISYTDTSPGALITGGRYGFGGMTTDGVGTFAWDDWSGGETGGNATVDLVNAATHDGAKTELPGWFGYYSGDHVPAQNWTVNTNFAYFVNTLAAITNQMVDDQLQAFAGIMLSAWQFELFCAVLGPITAGGLSAVNSLRDTLLASIRTAIAARNTAQTDYVAGTRLTFTGITKTNVRSSDLTLTNLTSGNRYYGSPTDSLGTIQAFLVFRVQATTLEDDVARTPVPQFPSVLLQRVFTAPSDLSFIFDNVPYRIRALCFRAYFFNLMWEYSPAVDLTATLTAPPVPKIDVISVLSIDVQIRLDIVGTDDTSSVSVQMSASSLFNSKTVTVKGGPLQSVYSLHIPGGPSTPVVGQYIRARRTDYLGSSDWSPILFVSADSIRNSAFISASGEGAIVSNPLNNLFSYTSTGTTITWSWGAFSLTYSDGFVQFVAGGSFTTFTGLANSTTYKFYPYLQGVRQAISNVVILLSSVSSGTAEDPAAIATTNGDNRTPLSRGAMDGSTTSGGAGSGSGGGIG